MNKPIIIDGVDVSECEYCMHKGFKAFPQCRLNIDSFATACMQHHDCNFKQLQRLKAENEQLKLEKCKIEDEFAVEIQARLYHMSEHAKYMELSENFHKTLLCIREAIKNMCEGNCPDLKNGYCIGVNECAQRSQKHITRLINEVLKDV